MAKLVIGTDKSVKIPAIVKEVGITPTGTINITSNGTTDVTQYASANVNVTPTLVIQKVKDANGKVVNGSTVINLDGATDVGDYALEYAYANNIGITGTVDLSSLTTVSGDYGCASMCANCTGITSIDLSSLITITGKQSCNNMFYECTGLTGAVDLGSLTTISGRSGCIQMFMNCPGITNVNLSSLSVITGISCCANMFQNCYSLTSLSFPALTSTSFGSQTNQFVNLVKNITGITLHFPSNVQSVIEGLTGYSTTAPFGAVSGTVLFDLPATN